jgi:hypothetical protein
MEKVLQLGVRKHFNNCLLDAGGYGLLHGGRDCFVEVLRQTVEDTVQPIDLIGQVFPRADGGVRHGHGLVTP